MKLKRLGISMVVVLFAAVTGVIGSFNPRTATALDSRRYVALGDSVAAGLGLQQTPDVPEELPCGRSAKAYPRLIAAQLDMPLEHYACSGAKVDEGLYGPQDLGDFTVRPQLERAFEAGTPDLMTVTIGANDARWSQFVRDCYVWRCGSALDDARATAYLLDLRWELYLTLEQIKRQSGAHQPRVYFSGYFVPLSPSAPSCTDTTNFSTAEMQWLNQQATALNQVIEDAVSWYGFAEFVPIDFSGHEICTGDPWVQGSQDTAPFHPTANGQKAMARQVLAAIRS